MVERGEFDEVEEFDGDDDEWLETARGFAGTTATRLRLRTLKALQACHARARLCRFLNNRWIACLQWAERFPLYFIE